MCCVLRALGASLPSSAVLYRADSRQAAPTPRQTLQPPAPAAPRVAHSTDSGCDGSAAAALSAPKTSRQLLLDQWRRGPRLISCGAAHAQRLQSRSCRLSHSCKGRRRCRQRRPPSVCSSSRQQLGAHVLLLRRRHWRQVLLDRLHAKVCKVLPTHPGLEMSEVAAGYATNITPHISWQHIAAMSKMQGCQSIKTPVRHWC